MRDTPTFIARIVPSVTAILGIATASLLVSSVFWYTHQRRDKQEDNGQRYTKISSLLGVKDLLLGRLIVGEKFQKEDCTLMQQQRNGSPRTCTIGGYESLIGNTPLIRLTALSQLLGREILLKVCPQMCNYRGGG